MVEILTANTVTKLTDQHNGQVVICASHGGLYAGYCAAKGKLRGVILNDAGVGKDRAGIGSLDYLDDLGLPAATVDHASARIGDADDMAVRGMISHVNAAARALGCVAGQAARDCAAHMTEAALWQAAVPPYEEGRFPLRQVAGEIEVWGLDSASLILPDDANRIVVTGSHGALLGGESGSALRVLPVAAVFNDAGLGADLVGITRLPALAAQGVIAATVAAASARIGDARSAWDTGVISHVNELAARAGAIPDQPLRDWILAVIRSIANQ